MNDSLDQYQWWDAKDDRMAATRLYDLVTDLRKRANSRMAKNIDCMTVYGNMRAGANYTSGYGVSPAAPSPAYNLPRDRPKFNIVSSMVDTVSAKICKMRPVITFLTEGGSWTLRRQGQNLGQFMRGLFYQNNVYQLHQQGFKDSQIFDVGALKHYRDGNRIITERVLAFEMHVEDVDAMYGTPRRLYQTKIMSKTLAKKAWPKAKKIIENAKIYEDYRDITKTEDQIMVVEAWMLPSSPGAGDGRHTIAVDGGYLLNEEYTRPKFPFTFFRWSYPGLGYWGQSLAERLLGNQIEINKMLAQITQAFHMGSSFKVFLEYGSRVVKEHLDNKIGGIVYYQGAKPTFEVPSVIRSEYFQHLQWLIQASYQEAGVSELSAQAKKPAGLDSRVAMREYNDLETERFVLTAEMYEKSFLETCENYMYLMEEMHEEGLDLTVSTDSKKFLKKIKWSDVQVVRDGFMMKMFPTSMLPHTPQGQLAMIQDLIESGVIPAEFALDLLDWPDLTRYKSLANAAIEDIFNTIERVLEGEILAPEPFQNLQLGLQLMQSAYLYYRHEDTPDGVLNAMTDWMLQAQGMLQLSQEQNMMAQQAQQMQQVQGQQAQLTPGATIA